MGQKSSFTVGASDEIQNSSNIKGQPQRVVKNLQQHWHTVLMIVTDLFLSLLIPLAILSPCAELQYLMDDEFHASFHSCAIPALMSPRVSCTVSAFPNRDPLNLNFLIPTPFAMSFQPWTRQQSVASSLSDFNSSPPWKETFCSYSYKPTSPWFILAEIQKETALGGYSNIFSASPILTAVFPFSSSPTRVMIFLTVQLRTTCMPKGPTVKLSRRK